MGAVKCCVVFRKSANILLLWTIYTVRDNIDISRVCKSISRNEFRVYARPETIYHSQLTLWTQFDAGELRARARFFTTIIYSLEVFCKLMRVFHARISLYMYLLCWRNTIYTRSLYNKTDHAKVQVSIITRMKAVKNSRDFVYK